MKTTADAAWYKLIADIQSGINAFGHKVLGTLFKLFKNICRLPGDYKLNPIRGNANRYRDAAVSDDATVTKNRKEANEAFETLTKQITEIQHFIAEANQNKKDKNAEEDSAKDSKKGADKKQTGDTLIPGLQAKIQSMRLSYEKVVEASRTMEENKYATNAQMYRGVFSGAPWDHLYEGLDKVWQVGKKAVEEIEAIKNTTAKLSAESNAALGKLNGEIEETYALLFEALSAKFGQPAVFLKITTANLSNKALVEQYLIKLNANNLNSASKAKGSKDPTKPSTNTAATAPSIPNTASTSAAMATAASPSANPPVVHQFDNQRNQPAASAASTLISINIDPLRVQNTPMSNNKPGSFGSNN